MTIIHPPATPVRTALAPLAIFSALLLAACGSEQEPPEPPAGGSNAESFSMAEVEENSTPDSCWVAIEGRVYDLTAWIDEHPGGPARIEQICGTEASDAFFGQHHGQERPREQLAEFEIGTLGD